MSTSVHNRQILIIDDDTRNILPDMDGYEGMIKLKEYGIRIPVIAVTAQAMAGDREKCMQAGASAYISKPVNIDSLTDLLNIYLK